MVILCILYNFSDLLYAMSITNFCSLYLLVLASTFTRPGWAGIIIELFTSRRSCASSLETFNQSFLHPAWPKTRRGSRPALIVDAHAFSWPPAHLRHVRGGVGRRRFLISSPSGRLAAWPNEQCWYTCKAEAAAAVPRMAHSLCALRVECGGCCHCQRPFVGYSYRPCLATVYQLRAHYSLYTDMRHFFHEFLLRYWK